MERNVRPGKEKNFARDFLNRCHGLRDGDALLELRFEVVTVGVRDSGAPVLVQHERKSEMLSGLEVAPLRGLELGRKLAVEVSAESANVTLNTLRSEDLDSGAVRDDLNEIVDRWVEMMIDQEDWSKKNDQLKIYQEYLKEVTANKTYTSLGDLTNALHQSSQVSSSIVILINVTIVSKILQSFFGYCKIAKSPFISTCKSHSKSFLAISVYNWDLFFFTKLLS